MAIQMPRNSGTEKKGVARQNSSTRKISRVAVNEFIFTKNAFIINKIA